MEMIDKILERYGESATREDITEEENIYIVKELSRCHTEASALLETIERFITGNETLSYIHYLIKRYCKN